ncbi:MAG: hypothetical protein GY757_32600, partial [bacterium]|nr:hypothetical protein [bacterium]
MIAILVTAIYLSLKSNLLAAFGNAVFLGLLVYALLFYSVEGLKIMTTRGPLKSKLGKTLLLPIIHTEPLALVITSLFSIYSIYGKIPPNPGARIVVLGMMFCYFFIIFELVNFFLNMAKYWNTDRLFNDPVKTGGLAEKIYPILVAHIIRNAFLLSIPPALLVFTGIFIHEQSLAPGILIKKYPDMIFLML